MGDYGTETTRERPPIDAAPQVRHLKDRGVRFELTDEREAERFLRESNFFFKVKAFAKRFSRYTNPGSERFGSYINLDFAYLAKLTRLDHHLRETVLPLALDIEHYMKVELNRMIVDAGDDPLRAHGVLLRLRARKEDQGAREEGRPLLSSVEGPGGQDPVRRPGGIGRQGRHLRPYLPATPGIGLAESTS